MATSRGFDCEAIRVPSALVPASNRGMRLTVLDRLCGFENSEDRCRIAEVTQSPSIGRDMLVRQGSNAEEISDLVKRVLVQMRA